MQKILIVEDEAAYLHLLSHQLAAKGYVIVEAINGEIGLEKAKTEKPDLILLDIRMSVVDGMTMLDLLRKDPTIHATNVIMLTNLEPNERIVSAMVKDQPTYYFVKSDMQFTELLSKIEEVLYYA